MRVWLFRLILMLLATIGGAHAQSSQGVLQVQSSYSFEETAQRLLQVLEQKGMSVFQQIDHAQNARKVGLELQPMKLFIFGNPKVGSKLMQCSAGIALDLPQKVLLREDEQARVTLNYNDMHYLAGRHDLEGCRTLVQNVSKALEGIMQAVVSD